MIQVTGVKKAYAQGGQSVPVLKGLDTTISAGEFMAIMDPSGSGKSTFMNILGCLDTMDAGNYELDGQRIDHLEAEQLASVRTANLDSHSSSST